MPEQHLKILVGIEQTLGLLMVLVCMLVIFPGCKSRDVRYLAPWELSQAIAEKPMFNPLESIYFGTFHTLDSENSVVEAIGVREGRIAYLGSLEEALEQAHDGTRLLDMQGYVGFPGFTDAHGHLYWLGAQQQELDLSKVRSMGQLVGSVSLATASVHHDEGQWLIGNGLNHNRWHGEEQLDGAALSDAIPSIPVFLKTVDHHAALVNAAALKLSGIGPDTPDPRGGRIIRDEEGRPNGLLIDAAVDLVHRNIPAPTRSQRAKRILDACEVLLAYGITAIHDADVDGETLAVLEELAQRGELPIRVYAMVNAQSSAARELMETGPRVGLYNHMLTVRALKTFADGSLGSRSALLAQPYSDSKNQFGVEVNSMADLVGFVRMAHSAKLQVAIHAIGDRANRVVLDALEAGMAGFGDYHRARPRVEHAQVVSEEDYKRFGFMGAVASVQPSHLASDMPWAVTRLGSERFLHSYGWRQLLSSGASLAFGTDFPIESPDPRRTIYVAITRKKPEASDGGPYNPQHALTIDEALRAYTHGPAYAAFEETMKGTLEEGKFADITFWKESPLGAEPDEILTIPIIATVIGGRMMYRNSDYPFND